MSPTALAERTETWQVFRVSAETPDALVRNLERWPDERTEGRYRLAVVARDPAHARELLAQGKPGLVARGEAGDPGSLVFLFPGVGDQYAGMARALYATLPDFRAALDECADLLGPDLGCDLRAVLFPAEGVEPAADPVRTRIAQPLVFSVEYALATVLQRWGLRPGAMLGYSIGEYTAACVSGVLALPDALHLVARRAELIEAAPPGAMLLVQLAADALTPYLTDGVALAAVNGPGVCVVAGPVAAVARLERELLSQAVPAMRAKTEHAFHSPMMAPIEPPTAPSWVV